MSDQNRNTYLTLMIVCILVLSSTCIQKQNDKQQTNMYVALIYPRVYDNGTEVNITVNILQNGIQNQTFVGPLYPFQCSNLGLFTLSQQYTQQGTNKPYIIQIQNLSSPIYGTIESYYSSPTTTPINFTCQPSHQCQAALTNNCISQLSYNLITITIFTQTNQPILKLSYNYICNGIAYKNSLTPVLWGDLILVIFSIFMIFLCSKFQQCKSFNNATIYINTPIILLINGFSIARFVIIGINLPNSDSVITYICYGGAIVATLPAVTVCLCQFVYYVWPGLLRYGCDVCLCTLGHRQVVVRVRVVDGVGVVMGIGVLCGVYFSHFNWIVCDVVFLIIFVASIKIIKLGSLRISLLAFALSLLLSITFVILTQTVTLSYIQINYFSNPLFLQSPSLSRIPNIRCTWYFLLIMLYPGLFLAYLQRFDRNRSSLIYAPTFIICYGLCSIAWFIVGSLIKPPLPYDLFTVPISMVLIVLFANRRGELRDIWEGRYYDQQRSYLEIQKNMISQLAQQKSASLIYDKDMFKNLKVGQKSDQSSNSSRFSQIIKGLDRQRVTQLRYMYSQGQQRQKQTKKLKQRDPLSNQTQRVSDLRPSQAQSGKWTLSKFS